MKIVVTNPSGLTSRHIQDLQEFGEVVTYDGTNDNNYAERMEDAEIAVIDCFLTPVTEELLAKSPNLKFFSINSTGFDKVDIDAVQSAGITASNVPHFSTDAVAEIAIGLMFAANRKITASDSAFRHGLMAVDPGIPEQRQYAGFDLKGKVLGVVGLGDIGARVAEVGNGIGMSVIGYNRTERNLPGVDRVSLSQLFTRADVIILCLALNEQTQGIITKELIDSMKTTAVFVSIAGLGLIDEDALKASLNDEKIAGAGIDTADMSWVDVRNTVLTPHNGYNTHESEENMGRIITDNIKSYIAGTLINRIV